MAFDLPSALIGAAISAATSAIGALVPVIGKHISESRLKKLEQRNKIADEERDERRGEVERQRSRSVEQEQESRRVDAHFEMRALQLRDAKENFARADNPADVWIATSGLCTVLEADPLFRRVRESVLFLRDFNRGSVERNLFSSTRESRQL